MDWRCYNLPTGSEIAILIHEDDERPQWMRGIALRLRKKGNNLEFLNECHHAYLPSHYVLLYPYDKLGWHIGLQYSDDWSNPTQMDYFVFLLFPWASKFFAILCGGNLFKQFIVDAWAATK
jgi:hypothetical protein